MITKEDIQGYIKEADESVEFWRESVGFWEGFLEDESSEPRVTAGITNSKKALQKAELYLEFLLEKLDASS